MVETAEENKKGREFLDPLPGQAIKQHERLQQVLQQARSEK